MEDLILYPLEQVLSEIERAKRELASVSSISPKLSTSPGQYDQLAERAKAIAAERAEHGLSPEVYIRPDSFGITMGQIFVGVWGRQLREKEQESARE